MLTMTTGRGLGCLGGVIVQMSPRFIRPSTWPPASAPSGPNRRVVPPQDPFGQPRRVEGLGPQRRGGTGE